MSSVLFCATFWDAAHSKEIDGIAEPSKPANGEESPLRQGHGLEDFEDVGSIVLVVSTGRGFGKIGDCSHEHRI